MVNDKPRCITDRRDTHDYYWHYTHSPGEPGETLEMAIRIAGEVAADQARKSGETYVVASTPQPSPTVLCSPTIIPSLSRSR